MAFDGTAYSGWQMQPNAPTVQETMEKALSTLLKEDIPVTGAGRTDSGVHASSYYAHFDASRAVQVDELTYKLNRFLPEDIVIYRIFRVPDDMHARFSALSRTYHYHFVNRKTLFNRSYVYFLHNDPDIEEINKCCKALFDYTDFTSFSKLHTDVETNNCTIMKADFVKTDEGYRFEIKANRFLRNMVRSITGTLIDVGSGKLDVNGFREIIKARDRGRAGMSVPAKGLFLVEVEY